MGFLLGVFVLGAGFLSTPSGGSHQDESEYLLVHYDFEEDDIETGPYTLSIFEGAKGSVAISSTFHYGGYRSVEIRDRAGDESFAELQGFFSDKWSGKLYIHFALLVAEPSERFNVAFAGNAHFSLQEHGLAVWLKGERGSLYQVSGSVEEPLFEIDAFTWYVFDIAYDVDRGTYDLLVTAEDRDEPIVALREQKNVLGIPGSQLRKYSFIGDIPGRDESNAWFYVDDIVVTNDVPVSETPFVAPGRRMLFVDMHNYYRKRLLAEPGCVPAIGYEDFDLSPGDLAELGAPSLLNLLEDEDEDEDENDDRLQQLSPFLRARITAMRDWRRGCRGGEGAVELFRQASRAVPDARIYPMSEVLALIAQKRFRDADALLLELYSSWQDDPRFPAIAASIGVARGDLDEADQWLSSWADIVPRSSSGDALRDLWSGNIEPGLVERLRAEFPSEWPDLIRQALSAELRFYVLLWQSRYREAGDYADKMVGLFRQMSLEPSRWHERRGDAAFYGGDFSSARRHYEESLHESRDPDSAYLKLSDTHFELGDFELERYYREKIYGSLRQE